MKNKDLLSKIRDESIYLVALLVITIIIFKIVFYNESFAIVLRAVISFFWLFVIPGFSLMYYWYDTLNFLERLLAGVVVSLVVIGTIGYYFGLIGIHARYHNMLLPPLIIALSAFIAYKK